MEDQHQWFAAYFERYRGAIFSPVIVESLVLLRQLLVDVAAQHRKVLIGGNGASAAIAGHCAVDLTKNARVPAQCFHDPSLITAFANDYGYEQWLAKCIEFYGAAGDAAILISSSGRSPNMVNAASRAKSKGMHVVTFTGFEKNNALMRAGDLNFWVESRAYNIIENVHSIWLTSVIDAMVGDAEAVGS